MRSTRHTDQIEPSRSSEHPVGHIFRAIAQSELLDHRIHLRYLSQNFRIDPLPDRIVLPLRIIERKLPLLPRHAIAINQYGLQLAAAEEACISSRIFTPILYGRKSINGR